MASIVQQIVQIPNPNRIVNTVIWLAVACYTLTIFLPIITLDLVIAYFDAMIFDVLSATGLVIFFLGLGSSIVAATAIKKPIPNVANLFFLLIML